MSVHIVPHGRVTEHVKRGLRWHSSVEKVHLLSSERYKETSIDLGDELSEFGYEVELHEIQPFELRSVVDTIVTIAKEYSDLDVYINVTGGTNLMAGAATSSAFFIGAKPYYVLEPQNDEPLEELIISLPAPKQPLTFDLSDSQREILEILQQWDSDGKTDVIGREIGDELGESAQNISYHIRSLDEKGLVETRRAGRRKEINITDVGRLYLRWTSP